MDKASFFTLTVLYLLLSSGLLAQTPAQAPARTPTLQRVRLPNGWSLTPAGQSIPLSSDFPLNMAVSPDDHYLAVTNNGHGKQTIDLIDLKADRLVNRVEIGRAWLGLRFENRRPFLYASGGNDNIVIRYEWKKDRLINKDTLTLGAAWPEENIGPAGLDVDDNRRLLYVVTKENNSLYVCDLNTKGVLRRIPLSTQAYTCLLNPSGTELYISAWGGAKVWIYNTVNNLLVDSITTEDHPNDMVLSHNGKWLFVANANSNSVSVISTAERKVVETLNAALYPMAPIGSTTNSAALSTDDKTLYIANADNNCLAVFDVSDPGHSWSKGFIPTGWYPTCVKVVGRKILVLNGKGMSSFPNFNGFQPNKKDQSKEPFIWDKFHGTLSVIPIPSEDRLHLYSRQVYRNTPYSKQKEMTAAGPKGNPIPMKKGDPTPIKYVFYILKENKTYDQVLGDMSAGNGDSSLAIFGEKVTPNSHALANQFVLLDNFYVDAEVSVDGHCWSMGGYATDFVEKNWRSDYSNRGGDDDFESGGPIASPTKGYLFDYCKRAGVSFRDYGEFMDNTRHPLPVLADPASYCKRYPSWDLGIEDVFRERMFEQDFDSLVAIHAVRHFNMLYLPNDHTVGLIKDSLTPRAYIADNDLALGRLVDHITHSPVWKESAIFVLEDDAGNGSDHVDAHRSVAWVISPYIKMHSVNHTLYSTSSVLRTMELILGLPPMSQYDAAATPLWSCFQNLPDPAPFVARPALSDTRERTRFDASALQPSNLDFSNADRVPDLLLNEIIWKSMKGLNSRMPAPKRAAFVQTRGDKDDDD
jgi:YVTN family beta-propeller protein